MDRLKATLAANRAWEEAQSVLQPSSTQNPLPPEDWFLWPVRVARRCLEDGAYLRAMQKLVTTPISLSAPAASQGRTQDAGFNPNEPRDKAGKWTSDGGSGGAASHSTPSQDPSLPPIFAHVLASNPKLRAEFEQARALHARLTPHDIALVNAWHDPQPSSPGLQQTSLNETGNAYGDENRPAHITYADTDTARDPVWRSNLLSTPETAEPQAKLVNAGLGGMATGPVARRMESYVWGLVAAELMKTQLWSDIRKRWQDWQNGPDHSQPPQNTVANQNDPTASPSKDDAGKGAKKGEVQGQASAGMPPPDDPNDPNHEKKGNEDQTSKPDPTPKPESESDSRPPWEKGEWIGKDGKLKGKPDKQGKTWTFYKVSNPQAAAEKFMEEIIKWLNSIGVVCKETFPIAKGKAIMRRFSNGVRISLRDGNAAGPLTSEEIVTLDVHACQELKDLFGEEFLKFKFNPNEK